MGLVTIIALQSCCKNRDEDNIMQPDLSDQCKSQGESLVTQGPMNFLGKKRFEKS